ncbi:MAG: hypothetical protein ACRDDY_02665 [Clostridium sp.]|uniref:hypothetical protein n=1 Tax=Clostridium sp. TaxID=1506 RepID=UPI003EE5EBB7
MERFKITNSTKNEVAREVKKFIKNKFEREVYTEMAIFYDVNSESFYVTESGNIDKCEENGDCFYKLVTWFKADNEKITIKNIISKIFN